MNFLDRRNILSIRIIIRLCIVAFLAGTTVGIWYFLPYFILDLKGGFIEVGLASTVPGLIAAFVQLSVGMILDKTEVSQDILVLGFTLSALHIPNINHLYCMDGNLMGSGHGDL